MNSAETVRQRVKYVLEHGEPYPSITALSKPLAVKLVLVLIVLQLVGITLQLTH